MAVHRTESCMAFAAYTESQGSMKQYSTTTPFSRSLVLSVVSNAICLSCASNMPRGDLLEWQGDFSKRITATFRVRNTLYQKAWSGISMCRHGQGITTAYIPSFMGLKRLVFRPRYSRHCDVADAGERLKAKFVQHPRKRTLSFT